MFNIDGYKPLQPDKLLNELDGGSAKLAIASLDGPLTYVYAQYYPKEISIDKSIPWNKHRHAKGNIPALEFTSAENRTMSLELFFDRFEDNASVSKDVDALIKLTMINESAKNESEKHPPRVMVVFSRGEWIRGVIESLSVKYTMFSSSGTPVRATCSIKIKEAESASKAEKSGS